MSFILGGLGARVDLLKQNFTLSMIGATTGVLFPIGLSYLLLYLGFGYGGDGRGGGAHRPTNDPQTPHTT
ncbi:unnamed protein product, partial [Penicillium nalgiovense]